MAERTVGEEARRIKRELLGVGERTKHRSRTAAPLKGYAGASGAQQRVYRFRFYPTAEQAAQLHRTFGACRWVYNEALTLRSKAWQGHRVSLGFAETCRALTGWKRVPPGRRLSPPPGSPSSPPLSPRRWGRLAGSGP